MTDDDLVVFRPHTAKAAFSPTITLPEWAEEKGREIAREKGWDYHVLRSNWLEMATEEATKVNPFKKSGASFIGYCKKQD